MRRNTLKSILIVVITAVLILVAAPSVAAACMDRTADNFDSAPWQKEAAVPLCCLTADCPLSHCTLTNAVDKEILLPNRSAPKENVYMALSQTSVTTETFLNPQKPLQWEPAKELPSYLYTEYHCRNCLDSEEPPQV